MNTPQYSSQRPTKAVSVFHRFTRTRGLGTGSRTERIVSRREMLYLWPTLLAVVAVSLLSGAQAMGEGSVFSVGKAQCCDLPMTVPSGLSQGLAVAAGRSHALLIETNGTVRGWGTIDGDNRPTGVSNAVQVAANDEDSLVLLEDGRVAVMGNYAEDVPADVTNVVQISADSAYGAALRRDGTAHVWGFMPSNWPAMSSNIVEISTHGSHALMLRADGTVLAYGSTPPSNLTNAVSVAAGPTHGLALRANGTVIAWGSGSFGETSVPADATNIVFIAAGTNASAAIDAKGKLFSWGRATLTNLLNTVSNASSISLGDGYAVGLRGFGAPTFTTPFADRFVTAGPSLFFRAHATGSLPMSYQWRMHGTNLPGATNANLVLPASRLQDSGLYSVLASNELGTATSPEMTLQVAPLHIVSAPSSRTLMPGSSVTLSVVAQGTGPLAYQWLFNGTNLPGETNATLAFTNVQKGQTGMYSVTVSNEFGAVTTAPILLSVSVVAEYFGGLFIPDPRLLPRTNTTVPLHDVVAISASGGFTSPGHTLALTSQGKVLAWGSEPTATNIPPSASNIIAIAAGEGHSLALDDQGRVFAWGNPQWGAPLGQDEVTQSLSNVVAIAAGENRVALMSNGVAVVWGVSRPGDPKQPPFWYSNVVAISAYAVIHEDGRVAAWYSFFSPTAVSNATMVASCETRGFAVLADGSIAHWGTAFQPGPALTNPAAIDCSRTHYLALQSDGTVLSWGDPMPTPWTNVIAIAAGEAYSAFLLGDGPPRMRADMVNPALDANGFSVQVPAESGRVYRLEYKDTAADTAWKPLPLVAGRAGTITLRDPAPAGAERYYRVRRW